MKWDGTAQQILLPGFYLQIVYGDDFRTVWQELRWSEFMPRHGERHIDMRGFYL